jgi:ABC-type transport system involved in multi-copper enzyme maturation permease subunit
MTSLIKLELRRNKIRTYIFAALCITAGILGLLYLFAATPYMETDDADMAEFMNYTDIMVSAAIVNMAAFCVLSAVMHSRFVVEEYKGSQAILLFSYPVSRKKVFLSKLSLVSITTIVGLIVSNLIVFSVFLGTESVFSLVGDKVTSDLLVQLIILTIVTSVLATAIGVVSLAIGFSKKSSQVTVVSAVVLVAAFCSTISNIGATGILAVAIGAVLLIAVFVTGRLAAKVNCMET